MLPARPRSRPTDDGSALVAVLGTMAVLVLFLLVTLSYAVQNLTPAREDQDAKAALAAAQAGVDDYLSRLNADNNYWQTTDTANTAYTTGMALPGTGGTPAAGTPSCAGCSFTYERLGHGRGGGPDRQPAAARHRTGGRDDPHRRRQPAAGRLPEVRVLHGRGGRGPGVVLELCPGHRRRPVEGRLRQQRRLLHRQPRVGGPGLREAVLGGTGQAAVLHLDQQQPVLRVRHQGQRPHGHVGRLDRQERRAHQRLP